MVVRLVWDQEAAGSNPVSPILINTGTMKKFSQYLNSNENCGCDEVHEGILDNITAFASGAAGNVLKTAGQSIAGRLGGPLATAAIEGGLSNIEQKRRGSEILDKEVINCSKHVDSLEEKLLRRRGKPDEPKIQAELDAAKDECKKIKAATNVKNAEKQLAAMRKAKADALRATP